MTKSDYIAKVELLESENAILRQKVNSKQQLIELSKQVEVISIRKDSLNSSMPPSSDFFKKNQSLRNPSGRKPGGQNGHKCNTLKMVSNPDHIVPIVPEFCNICAAKLDSNQAILVNRRQVIDIPPIKAEVTEYRVYEVVCNCGHHQRADFPLGVDIHIQYGPNITTMAVYQSVFQYIPFKRLQDFFQYVCNLPISTGTLENMIASVAQKGLPIWENFRQSIEQFHLLRELTYLEQVEKIPWASQFKQLLLDAIELKKNQKSYPKDDLKVLSIENKLDHLLQNDIIPNDASKTIVYRNSMLKYKESIFPFLYNQNVLYDNNASERSIRNVKVKLKVSGQFKSRQEQYCILRSIIDTTIKNGQSVFHAIYTLVNLQSPPKAAV